MLFAILLSATLLQLIASELEPVDEGKYKKALDAVSDALVKRGNPQSRVKAAVKKFSDEFTKFSADAAALTKIEDEASAASAAEKLLKSLKQLEETLTAVSVKPTALAKALARAFEYIVGKCLTTPDALKSQELAFNYICKDNSAVLKKCVTELDPQKRAELAAVWSYYDLKGIRQGPRSLCRITETSGTGNNFFTKTLGEWPSGWGADTIAYSSTNDF